MRSLRDGAIVLALLALGTPASAVVIDFNDGTPGATIGSSYAGLGVTFSNAEWMGPISNQSGTPSEGVFLVDSTAGWNPPFSPTPTTPIIGVFTTPVAMMALLGVDIGFNGVRMDVYDAAVGGNLLGTDSFFGVGAGVGTFYSLSFSLPGIERFEVYQVTGLSGDGMFFDNLEFAPVPEPGSVFLVAAGILGLVVRRRRNKG